MNSEVSVQSVAKHYTLGTQSYLVSVLNSGNHPRYQVLDNDSNEEARTAADVKLVRERRVAIGSV